MSELEKIGICTTLSGGLIVIDTGYLGIWSHDRPPALADGELSSDELVRHANSFVDLRIGGADAERAIFEDGSKRSGYLDAFPRIT
jgi:hypothetical protein